MITEPIRIDFDKGELKTPDHLYVVKSNLAISHEIEFEFLQPQAAYGLTFTDYYGQDENQIKLFNEGKAAEGIAIVVNRRMLMKNMQMPSNPSGLKIDKRHHAILQIAALFLIREDENMRVYDQEFQNTKIQDFLDSGVEYEDLFLLAVKLVPGLLTALQEVSRIISEVTDQSMEKVKEVLKKFTPDKEK